MNAKKTSIVILIFFTSMIFPSYLYTLSNQHVWQVNSPIIRDLEKLHLVNGLAKPSIIGPSTTIELLYTLERLTKQIDPLPAEQQALYQHILEQLTQPPRIIIPEQAAIDISLRYSFETYIHTNDTDFTVESQWNPRWLDRLPILSVPIDFGLFNIFSASVDFVVMKELDENERVYAKNISTNHTLRDFFQLDFNWPYRAVMVAGGNQWNVQLGRDKLSLGPGHTGNLLLSDHLPYHDYIQFKTWFGPITYSTSFVGFPTPKEMGEVSDDNIKVLITHRFDWNILPRLHIAITEAMMYQDAVFDFRFINPMMFYHQYFMPDRSNSLITAELWGSIFRGLSFYTQFAMDEVQISGESATIPNALGWQLGLEYAWISKQGAFLLWAEYVHTDPYLYMRDSIDFIVAFKNQGSYVKHYVGYPLGGDTHKGALGFTWDSLDKIDTFLLLAYENRGEVTFDSPYPPGNPTEVSPTGIVQSTFRSTLGVTYKIPIPRWGLIDSKLQCTAKASYILIDNYQNQEATIIQDGQFSFALNYIL